MADNKDAELSSDRDPEDIDSEEPEPEGLDPEDVSPEDHFFLNGRTALGVAPRSPSSAPNPDAGSVA